MKTAIVILNYNDYENTKRYVESIASFSHLDKIIIVDNFSTAPKELEKLQRLQNDKVEVIASDRNGGYAYGNNVGLRYLDTQSTYYDYVIISNPDVSVEEKAIQTCVQLLENQDEAVIAAPRMHFVTGAARRSAWKNRAFWIDVACCTRITNILLYPLFYKGEYHKKDWEQDVLAVDAIAGSFFVVKHRLFQEIGYFDENTFLFFEEDILAVRAAQKGHLIYSVNTEKFIHYESQCIGKLFNLFRKQDLSFDSRIYYHKTYHHISKAKVLLLQLLRYVRKLELCLEVPIRKILKK